VKTASEALHFIANPNALWRTFSFLETLSHITTHSLFVREQNSFCRATRADPAIVQDDDPIPEQILSGSDVIRALNVLRGRASSWTEKFIMGHKTLDLASCLTILLL
jgi:hypothetical protein